MSNLHTYTNRALSRLRATRAQPLRLLNWAGWLVVTAAFIRSIRRGR
jgi:hypothetical protein